MMPVGGGELRRGESVGATGSKLGNSCWLSTSTALVSPKLTGGVGGKSSNSDNVRTSTESAILCLLGAGC